MVGVQAVDGGGLGIEQNLATSLELEANQVLDDLLLAVDGDRPAAAELGQRDAMALALEAQLDAVVDESFAQQALAGAGLHQEVDGALFEDPRLDARAGQQMSQHEASRASADDPNLRAHIPRR